MTTRRDFLRTSLASSLALGALGPLGASAQVSGYKALVFVLLRGGMDAHDTLIPTDASGYSTWFQARESIVSGAGASRELDNLYRLGTDGSPDFGLPPELAELGQLYDSGDMAILANVGPLEEPTTRQQIIDQTVQRPPRLASHNDQQSVWQTGFREGATTGWGGMFMDSFGSYESIARVCVGQSNPWVSSAHASGLKLGPGGFNYPLGVGQDGTAGSRHGAMMPAHYRSEGRTFNNVFMQDVAQVQREAYDSVGLLIDVLEDPGVDAGFRSKSEQLSANLNVVAKMIKAQSSFGVPRQVFFVSMQDFDVHGSQVSRTPEVYGELVRGLTDFYSVLKSLGMEHSVTTFTATEFGRTLQSNSAGTDHGWGSHSFILGGSVKGGKVYGDIPPSDFGHDQDWRRGAMIPTTAVEQYAEVLGRWFGVDESGINNALPKLGRFGSMSESFL